MGVSFNSQSFQMSPLILSQYLLHFSLALVSGCEEQGVNLWGRSGSHLIKGASSWEECAGECLSRRSCNNWVWHYQGNYAGNCYLVAVYSKTVAYTNTITGTRACQGSKHKWVEYQPGSIPLILTVPHDGDEKPKEIHDRSVGGIADWGTRHIAETLADGLKKELKGRPHIVLSKLHRSKMDPNREIVEAAEGNAMAEEAWNAYHEMIEDVIKIIGEKGPGLVLDIHGQKHGYNICELGYYIEKDNLNSGDYTEADSTIRELIERNGKTIDQVLSGSQSLGALMEKEGLSAVPSNKPERKTPGSNDYFRGGYSIRRHGSKDGNTTDAIQIEVQSEIRVSKAGGGWSARKKFADNLAKAVAEFMNLYYGK